MKYLESKMKTSCLKNLEVNKSKRKFTDQDLEKFRLDPTRNPITGREIKHDGKIYKQLRSELDKKDEYELNECRNVPPKMIVKKLKPKALE
jgi:hypothetical protein